MLGVIIRVVTQLQLHRDSTEKKLQNLKFCSFAAKMCKSTSHFTVQQHFMLKSQPADAREAAISSRERHAQLKNQAKQKHEQQREVYFAMAHGDERRLNCRMGVEESMCLTDRRASRARAAMRSGVRAVRPGHGRS